MLLLIGSIILCQLAGAIGTVFTISAIPTWYAGLIKPSFSPPNYIFGPVWITLYTLMGISLYLVAKKGFKAKGVRESVIIFLIHLLFNSVWSILFFGLQNPGMAFSEIVILWFLIILTIFKFWKINKLAAYLLIPYLFWVTFASILNFEIWRLN